jgi:hypothetical protein
MAIGVFIASILLYWEALFAVALQIARHSSDRAPFKPLPDPDVPPLAAICGLDQKGVFFDAEELVSIDRAGWNTIQGVADIIVEQDIVFNSPAAAEFGDKLASIIYLACETAVRLESVTATLDFVGILPLTNQNISPARRKARARGQ